MAVSGVKYILSRYSSGVMSILAVMACRAAALFIRLGALRWGFESADEFNSVAELTGNPRRISHWENAKMITEYAELRDAITYVAGLPVLPWEREHADE